ncbi:MAG: glycine hydroxymethyltransferase [Candidatus Deianiraeaceae bacterium]|jgi:glycine hydroxymethyltransferase
MSLNLKSIDIEIHNAIVKENQRQEEGIELIASENITSKAVMEAQGSVMTNKYAEGYPNKRYYGGCENMDTIESLAIDRLKKLFECNFVNVQPHSGATANQCVYFAFIKPGDTIMGLALDCGGHLTHGAKMTQSGKWFNSVEYRTNDNGLIDYDQLEKQAIEVKPKLIVAGTSSYSRIIDWKRFREIADKVGAILMIDMAHVAGLVAGGQYPNPLPYADVVTSTTHKTLRGPRGGIILWNNEEYTKKINSAVFPGMIGGPLMHVIAAKAVCFGEALQPSFKKYAEDVVNTAKILSKTLIEKGLNVITGGTDCHLLVVDLTPYGVTGKDAEKLLEMAHLTCNKNAIPNDPAGPFISSGIRLGTSVGVTRGFGEKEFVQIGLWIAEVLLKRDDNTIKIVGDEVKELCKKFPIYS